MSDYRQRNRDRVRNDKRRDEPVFDPTIAIDELFAAIWANPPETRHDED